jgi:hypothetical protein
MVTEENEQFQHTKFTNAVNTLHPIHLLLSCWMSNCCESEPSSMCSTTDDIFSKLYRLLSRPHLYENSEYSKYSQLGLCSHGTRAFTYIHRTKKLWQPQNKTTQRKTNKSRINQLPQFKLSRLSYRKRYLICIVSWYNCLTIFTYGRHS